MKYTFATIAAFASVALAQPAFLNSKFDVQEGKPFTIKYSGCEGGCTITLQNGKSTDTKDVEVLTATAEGDSFTFTPGNLPSDTYNFKIKNNEDGTINYSGQFAYEGTGTLPSKTEAETSAAETSAAETTSAEETSAPATTEATTLTTVSKPLITTKEKTTTEEHTTIHTPIATKNATTPIPTTKKATSTGASSTGGSESTAAETSAAATGSATTVPESGAARMTSSLALIAGAVMAMVYLN